jgi:hypothetical protein
MPRRPGETTLLRRKRERLEVSSTIVRFRRKPADPSLQVGSGWETGCRTLFLDQSKKNGDANARPDCELERTGVAVAIQRLLR